MLPINPTNYPHGVNCGCLCDCSVPLTEGNAMEQDVTDADVLPWEKSDPEAPRVMLLICANCYVGNHAKP